MITVIKKKGNQPPFDPDKIKTSIINAGNDGGIVISSKEAELMTHDVKKNIVALRGEDGVTSSYEVRELIKVALKNFGFPQIVEFYERGKLHDTADIRRHLAAIEQHRKALEDLTEGNLTDVKKHKEMEVGEDLKKSEDPSEPEDDYEFADLRTEIYKSKDH